MEINQLKKINLPEFLGRQYQVQVTGGKAHCPFHPPDLNQSFSVYENGAGIWLWKDFHDADAGGSIIDFVALKDGLSVAAAIQKIKQLEGLEDRPAPARSTERRIEKVYEYTDEAGELLFQKVRYTPKAFSCRRPWKDGWSYSLGGLKAVPYRLSKIKGEARIFLCEGEKDADLLAGLGYAATSPPWGAGSWRPELNPYFRGKTVYICYDVGNEDKSKKIAAELRGSIKEIFILSVPLEKREADISDYLGVHPLPEDKTAAFEELIFSAVKYEPPKAKAPDGVFIGSLEEFMAADIAKAEPLVDPLVFRSGFSMAGGMKGTHKSFFVIQLGLHLAAGRSPFLNSAIAQPARVLLIQQEISVGFMRERLQKINEANPIDTAGRFIPVTTTANQIRLISQKGLDQVKGWIDKFEPELLILDPISSFHDTQENDSVAQAKIRDVLNRLKAQYNMAVLITHHFSSKRSQNDPLAPTEAGGWFRGHSCLSDAADVLICLHRLPGQRENPGLSRSYEDYNQVQVQLRNGRWPERFAIEFDEETFLLRVSDVWREMGRKIIPGQVCTLLEANDGEMRRQDVINSLARGGISPMAVRRAIDEAVGQGQVEKKQLFGKGAPVMLRLKSAASLI